MTDTIAPIDAQTAYDLLEAAVQLAGADHVVDACHYVDSDGRNPSCIAGVALAIHGVPLEVMREWDLGYGLDDSEIDTVAPPFIMADAINVFAAAQRVQDRAIHPRTWGHALAAANAKLDELKAAA